MAIYVSIMFIIIAAYLTVCYITQDELATHTHSKWKAPNSSNSKHPSERKELVHWLIKWKRCNLPVEKISLFSSRSSFDSCFVCGSAYTEQASIHIANVCICSHYKYFEGILCLFDKHRSAALWTNDETLPKSAITFISSKLYHTITHTN